MVADDANDTEDVDGDAVSEESDESMSDTERWRARQEEKESSTGEEREAEIKAAAIDIFAEHGFHATKVSDIVSEVGVAQGTFYLHFEGKRELFKEILRDFLSLVLETVGNWEPAALESREALRDELIRVGTRLTRVLVENRELTAIFFQELVSGTPEFDELVREFHTTLIEMLSGFNEVLYERDLIESANFRILANMTIGMVERIIMEHVVHDEFTDVDPEVLVSHLVEHFLSGTTKPLSG